MENKKKIAAGGAGVVTVLGLVFGYVDGKTADLKDSMALQVNEVRRYVDSRHESVEKRLDNIETLLMRIDDRVYLIRKNQTQGE